MTEAELLRTGWTAMFLIGISGASLLLFLVIKDRLSLGGRDGVLRAQANSTVSDAVLLLMCGVCGLLATAGSWAGMPLLALTALLLFGFFFNILILNMLRGRRAVTASLKITIDKLEEAKAKARMIGNESP